MKKCRMLLILPLSGGALTVGIHLADAISAIKEIDLRILPTDPLKAFYTTSFRHIENETERQRKIVEHINLSAMGRVVEFKPDIVLVMALAPISPWFIENSKKLGALIAHWYVENYRYAPAVPIIPRWQIVAPYYDYFFTIQKTDFFKELASSGVRNFAYIPTGCNPRIHHKLQDPPPRDSKYQSEIGFVGAPYPNRIRVFHQLEGYPLSLWGPGWDKIRKLQAFSRGNGNWITSPEERVILNATRIGLNIHSSLHDTDLIHSGDFLNPRVFTLAACGTFQLVDDPKPLREVFEPGKEVATYQDLNTLKIQLSHFLKHPEERDAIARRAFERVMDEHTYEKRMQEMLNIMGIF